MFLILEFASNGNLFRYLRSKPQEFGDSRSLVGLFRKICGAVQFIHDNDMVHRDIKPENILMDDKAEPKLCDFGWTINLQKNESRQTFCGTYEYMAPEIFRSEGYNSAVDIWSLGILLFELFHGFSPFSGSSVVQIYKNIMEHKLAFKEGLHPHVAALVRRILQLNPTKRPSVADILQDKCLTEPLVDSPPAPSRFLKATASGQQRKPKTTDSTSMEGTTDFKATIPMPGERRKDGAVNGETLTAKRVPAKASQRQAPFQFSKQFNEKSLKKDSVARKQRRETAEADEDSGHNNPYLSGVVCASARGGQDRRVGEGSGPGQKHPASALSRHHTLSQEKSLQGFRNTASDPPPKPVPPPPEKRPEVLTKLEMMKIIGQQECHPARVPGPLHPGKSTLTAFSKKISLYMNPKVSSRGAFFLGCPFDGRHREKTASQLGPDNSASQQDLSKHSASNFSAQLHKPSFQNYYSNKSNFLDKKKLATVAPTPKHLPEFPSQKRVDRNDTSEADRLRGKELLRNKLGVALESDRGGGPGRDSQGEEEVGARHAFGQPVVDIYHEDNSLSLQGQPRAENHSGLDRPSECRPKASTQLKRGGGLDSARFAPKGVFKDAHSDDCRLPKKSVTVFKR